MIPVGLPLPADSPRLDGEDPDHIRLLAGTTAPLPPILVHRSTMRVIDGMHRLRAAMLRGDTEIAVEFFDGTEAEAFARGVRENVTHGLPLSRADREAAAARIITAHREWSDRALAQLTGLSATTVAAVRARSTG
ncbi:ParB/RepB/Spo0J family partition protein, partial [Actinosynnema sp. NPDC023658]|uniref:ParB/RepB/Spo0J family partition protein n=1 Tax=Actinosynnema sp. NPDC023658 TaxID=3155465 RepID=UPI0034091DF3